MRRGLNVSKPIVAREWIGKHYLGVAVLVVLFVGSGWAVRHFKRPGQMSVIESQAMDMTAMKPPVGSAPVATEFVSMQPFSAKVRYTGSVAPLNEQNIHPRVQGWLTGLKVYSGDRVRAGQLLATIDSPDLQNKLSEATYGHVAALREIPVAQANLAQTRAERNASRREIQAAEQDMAGARARVTASRKMVSQAQKDLKSAQASLAYWRTEIDRERSLLKQGAVSQQEFDSERAQSEAAEAEVENKQSKVEEAQANVGAAQAELSNKQIAIQVARDKASASDAALSAAAGEVGQKAANAEMAGAARSTAATLSQYRIIRAPFDGVVTKRAVSPGVLVSPGQAILNIAQIDRVRLQANVAEQDLAGVSVGAEVTARVQKGAGREIHATVTSISPSADSTSRTSVVEVIVDNRDHGLVPGDFISMEIATSESADAITVPSGAVVSKDGRDAVWTTRCAAPNGKATYYCTMHPEVVSDKPGICPKCSMNLEKKQADTGKTAHLTYVTTGTTDGDRTRIVSGLGVGDEVIYAGHRYLREGDAVTPVKWGEDGPAQLPGPSSEAQSMKDMPGMGGSRKTDSMPGMDMSGPKTGPSTAGMADVPAMDMKPTVPRKTAKPASTMTVAGKTLYTCPMHPEFITSDPKALCPKCGMRVEKMIKDAAGRR